MCRPAPFFCMITHVHTYCKTNRAPALPDQPRPSLCRDGERAHESGGGHEDAGVEEGGSSAQVAVGRRGGGVRQGRLMRARGGSGWEEGVRSP